MAVKTLQYFKDLFKTGYVITEADYADWLDSFRHAGTPVPLGDTTGLASILAGYRRILDKVPVGDIQGLSDYITNLTANYLTTSSIIPQNKIEDLAVTLANFVTVAVVQQMINDAVGASIPNVGVNGNWWVNGVDTGTQAGGSNGVNPIVNAQGNWEVDGVDTGIKADYSRKTDYNANISGPRTGEVGGVFTASGRYKAGSISVWMDGLRMSKGNDSDFVEHSDTQIQMNRAVTMNNKLIFEYLPKD